MFSCEGITASGVHNDLQTLSAVDLLILHYGNRSPLTYIRRLREARAWLSRKSAIIFGQGTIPEPSTPRISREAALVAWTAALVYIYARISQIAEIHNSGRLQSRYFSVDAAEIVEQETGIEDLVRTLDF
jgi:hypothetical protein